jgi:hypothetical protein
MPQAYSDIVMFLYQFLEKGEFFPYLDVIILQER